MRFLCCLEWLAFSLCALRAQSFYLYPAFKAQIEQARLQSHRSLQTVLSASPRPTWLGSPSHDLPQPATAYPAPHEQELVKPLLVHVSAKRIQNTLRNLTEFHTRHYNSQDGRNSQRWLLSQVQQVATSYALKGVQVHVSEFEHAGFPQRSILRPSKRDIARISGRKTDQDESLVIIGAHLDSVNLMDLSQDALAPGADDDGSGTTTLLETLHVLAEVGYAPDYTVELHWYAAEEGGILGSQEIANQYEEDGRKVKGMTQFDMTAWVKNGTNEVIGIVSSDVDIGLMALHVQLVNEYSDLPSAVFRIAGLAGSDHEPWYFAGYPSSCLTEGLIKNANWYNIHTANDRMDVSPEFSIKHMRRFVQHAIAFVGELAGGSHALMTQLE